VEHLLPPRLDMLLAALRAPTREQVVVRGWSAECEQNEHQFARWMSGLYRPPVSRRIASMFPGVPGPTLELVLYICTNCEVAEVRDRTLDRLVDFDGNGRRKLVASGRRDGFLGWYAGARKNNRVYIGAAR
jgi:hypothetical protein